MDIPLKSQPKVSMVNLLDDSKFRLSPYCIRDSNNGKTNIGSREVSASQNDVIDSKNYKLTRTYSETEKNNFDLETGHRLFDDGKIRPQISRNNSHREYNSNESQVINKIYSKSHNEYMSDDQGCLIGLEDEYVPGLDFGDLIYRWNKTSSDQNLSSLYDIRDENTTTSTSTSTSNTPRSRDASYLDLNKLHAKVAPQPIKLRNQINNNKFSFSKLNEIVKLRTPKSNYVNENNESTATLTSDDDSSVHKNKKQKQSIINPDTGDINYELIITSLPPNFNELPYSQRKKLVQSFSESIDYSQFSLFAKSYLNDKVCSSSGKTPKSGSTNSSFLRRSRHNSTNTIAGRLLAMSSTDLKKLHENKPKVNVDEKGAIVLDHELGKVIGFGAWGTIRECTGTDGVVRAIKIVKSCRDFESGTSSKSDYNNLKHHNPKVLEFFRNEIKIWEQLDHENVLPLLKYLETDNAIFCITNRICGGTLFELVSSWGVYNSDISNTQGPIGFSIENQRHRLIQVVIFIKQIVNALVYLHQDMGIVHGDLKLENVLVDDHDKDNYKMILCDFGMSKVYSPRLSRKSSKNSTTDTSMMRSKSSTTGLRKPYKGDQSVTRHLVFSDDSKIGISNLLKPHGPSLQSIDLTPTQSRDSFLGDLHERFCKSPKQEGIESDLPHSHIGSLPYAAPELLSPSPPPLGPSADVWALGVLMYTMVVGKLPFQHQYEPRLRAIISAGKYNKEDLKKACLIEWVCQDKSNDSQSDELPSILSPSLIDMEREEELKNLHKQWLNYDKNEFRWLYKMICGCLEINITKRWDIEMINDALSNFKSF